MVRKMKQYILSLDQGTTSTRAILFDKNGQVVIKSQKELPQYYPHISWVEQDANEIWNSVLAVISECLGQSGIQAEQIAAIGITNQRETTVVWDKKTGKPIYRAIVWQSKQTKEVVEQWREEGLEKFFYEKTGLILDAYFSASKLVWILDHVPEARTKAEAGDLLFGTIDSWLLWKLTNGEVHATDYTNASRTMLFNINTKEWDEEILARLHLPKSLFPEVKENSGCFGYTVPHHFYGQRVPIAGIAGDQQASLFGHMILEPGMVKSTYGTGAFIMMNTGTERIYSKKGLLTTIAYTLKGQTYYALEGSVFIAGSAIQWLKNNMHFISSATDSQVEAEKVADSGGVYVVPAFSGLGTPYWDQEAKGAIYGLTLGTEKAHLVRATLESLAYQTRDVVQTMEEEAGLPLSILRVDGGAANNDLLLQFQADILNLEVERAAIFETTALGVAYFAGLAVGFWSSLEEIKQLNNTGRIFSVMMEEEKRKKLYEGWQRAIAATIHFSE